MVASAFVEFLVEKEQTTKPIPKVVGIMAVDIIRDIEYVSDAEIFQSCVIFGCIRGPQPEVIGEY